LLAGLLHYLPPANTAPEMLRPDASDTPLVEWGTAPAVWPPHEYEGELVCRVYRVTAYCDRGLTAVGVPSGVGQCAAPADIPFGARVYVPALDRVFIVTDRTARRFRHNTVDLFIPSRAACKQFGRQYLECEIALPAEPACYGSPRLCAVVAAASG
jgi:3D (Asp-Asp-Asp) domain-containing protein